MLRALMGEVESLQEQIGSVSRTMEILRENQKEMLKIKKHCNRNEECLWMAYY